MVDVAPAEAHVPEWPPAASHPGRREPHECEREHETRKQVEEHGLGPGRGLVAFRENGDGVLRRLACSLDCLLGPLEPGLRRRLAAGAAAGKPDALANDHSAATREGDPRQAKRQPTGAAASITATDARPEAGHRRQ